MKHTDLRGILENMKHLGTTTVTLSRGAVEELMDEWDRVMDLVDDPV